MTGVLTMASAGQFGRALDMDMLGTGWGGPEMTGAGEGIRTLDPDLGKVVLYP